MGINNTGLRVQIYSNKCSLKAQVKYIQLTLSDDSLYELIVLTKHRSHKHQQWITLPYRGTCTSLLNSSSTQVYYEGFQSKISSIAED